MIARSSCRRIPATHPPRAVRPAQVVNAKAHAGRGEQVPDLVGVPTRVAELEDVRHVVRQQVKELSKSVGVAVQDLAAATLVLAAARERGAGQEIELEEISV